MGTAAISNGDFIHACMAHADLLLLVGHDTVEKPPVLMEHDEERTVIHLNYFGAKVCSLAHTWALSAFAENIVSGAGQLGV